MGGAVAYRGRAELRRRWKAWVALGLLVGLLGGLTTALAAGARRTETAHERLVEAERPFSSFVADGGFSGDIPTPPDFLDRVASLPVVRGSVLARNVSAEFGRTEEGVAIGEPDYLATVLTPAEGLRDLNRRKLLHGRRLDPEAPNEMEIGFTVGDRYDLDVGDRLELSILPGGGSTEGEPVTVDFEVVGITAAADEFPPQTLGDGAGTVVFSPAFGQRYPELVGGQDGLVLEVPVEDLPALERQVEELTGGVPADALLSTDFLSQRDATQDAIHLLAVALWGLAALAAVATVLVIGQALLRATATEADDTLTLWALGFGRRPLLLLAAGRVAVVALVGTVAAAALATAASPLFPVGLARIAEPDPGVDLDLLVVPLGLAALVVVVTAAGALAHWRVARRVGHAEAQRAGRPSMVVGAASSGGLPPPAVAGVRLALEAGRGTMRLPVRSTLGGAALAVAVFAAVATFAGSLDHLLSTPRLFGWNWDASIGDGYGPDGADVPAALDRSSDVEAYAQGGMVQLEIDGSLALGVALGAGRGGIGPSLLDGRAASAADEVVLGRGTLDDLGKGIGDEVSVRSLGQFDLNAPSERAVDFRVVGVGVLPEQSEYGLDEGAVLTLDGLGRAAPEQTVQRNFFPLRFEAGVDDDRALTEIDDAVDAYAVRTLRPTDLVNFGRVEALPAASAGVVAVVAAAMLAHTLLSSIRRRRRELALYKTLGFTTRQIVATVAWQATTLVSVALLVGLPVGVALGRWAWILVAERLGVVVEPVIAVAPLLLVVPATVLVANLLAAVPARLAGNLSPALALRAE